MPDSAELPGANKGYRLTSYAEGVFQPNGQKTDPLLSEAGIRKWDEDNRAISQGKAWGVGQGLYLDGTKSLVFGRQPDLVDVVMDRDPDENGYQKMEGGVSRKHFELGIPVNGTIPITDLGSRNGTCVIKREKNSEDSGMLYGNKTPVLLERGDAVYIGGGGDFEGGSRLVGFTVCEDSNGKIFLVKFNAADRSDIFAAVGLYEEQGSPEKEVSELDDIYQEAAVRINRLWGTERSSLAYMREERGLVNYLYDRIDKLTEERQDGEWDMSAASVSRYAMEFSKKPNLPNADIATAVGISLLTIKMAQGLVEKVGPDKK